MSTVRVCECENGGLYEVYGPRHEAGLAVGVGCQLFKNYPGYFTLLIIISTHCMLHAHVMYVYVGKLSVIQDSRFKSLPALTCNNTHIKIKK